MLTELVSIAFGLTGFGYGAMVCRAMRRLPSNPPPAHDHEFPPEMKVDADTLISGATSSRFSQDGVLWTIIGSFWSTNAVLLVALGASGKWAEVRSLKVVI